MFEYERPAWQKQAACRGMDINIFFPKRGQTKFIEKAKKVCASCPVMNECREYGIELAQEFDTIGIFGGLATINRKQLMRQQGVRMVYKQAYKDSED